jgi:hypothetical protein
MRETEAFVQGFLQNLQFEVVKTKLLCETSFENYKLPLPQRRFRGQTAACATLGLRDLRGTLRHYHYLRPYSKTIFRATIAP